MQLVCIHVGSVFTLSHPALGVPGGNVSLQCNFTGYLPLNYEIQWTNESGMIIDSDYSSTVVSNEAGISQSGRNTTEGGVVSTLTLLSVDVDDNGPYTCAMLGTELKGTVSLLILGKQNNKNNKALVLIVYLVVFYNYVFYHWLFLL